jgi:hypothetical protein
MTAAGAARTCADSSRWHSISLFPHPPAGSYLRRVRTAAFFSLMHHARQF